MSSIVDLFTSESQIPVKFGDFYRLTRAAAERDLIMNAVNCNVPHRYIRETVTGEPETEGKEDQHDQDENRMD